MTNIQNALSSKIIAAALQPFVESEALAGAVALVANKDTIVSIDTVGYADIANKKPMAADTLFWIASQTKPITATIFMMLVDEGLVSIEDPVSQYVPEFADIWVAAYQDDTNILLKKPSRAITVRDILSHMSGLPFASVLERPTLDSLPLDVATRSYAMSALQSEPGARFSYSNAGINTAGRIIEILSGQSYWDFLRTRLLEPLGMTETTFWPNASQLDRLAKVYKPNAENTGLEETTIGQFAYPLDAPTRHVMPAGGLFSTAADVVRFCQLILNEGVVGGKRLLSESAIAQMTSRHVPDEIEQNHGLGWFLGGESFGHGGALSTDMQIFPNRDLITVYLVQHAGFPLNGGEAHGAFFNAAKEG